MEWHFSLLEYRISRLLHGRQRCSLLMGHSPWLAPSTHTLQIPLDFILMFLIQSLKFVTRIFLCPHLCLICTLRILVLKDTRDSKIRDSNNYPIALFYLTWKRCRLITPLLIIISGKFLNYVHFLHMMSAFSCIFNLCSTCVYILTVSVMRHAKK